MKTNLRQFSRRPQAKGQAGFSLFELVVFVLSVAIIYAYAAQRFATYPGEAEKANFIAVTTQLQNSMTLQTFTAQLSGGSAASVAVLQDGNPMDLMLRPPRNYFGVMPPSQAGELPRRSWYFDSVSRHLVYLLGSGESVYLEQSGGLTPSDEIRLRIEANYGEVDRATGLPVFVSEDGGRTVAPANRELRFNGLILAPVTPYQWNRSG